MSISENTVNSFLKSLSYDSKYCFLEEGKDDKELKEICEKRGIVFPSPDIAVLKMIYAYIDKTNLNGCRLPKDEVLKALPTLVGKAIDFDHMRERVCGYMLDAKLEDDKIIAYGAFFKSSLGTDYDTIKDLFNSGSLAVSFEAWGTREINEDGQSYNLKEIIFAGLGLLLKTKPAFPGAGVVEMANSRVLEFAKVMTEPKSFVISNKDRYLEKSRMYSSDFETIMRLMSEVTCPLCQEKWTVDVDNINFQENTVKGTCFLCSAKVNISLTPRASIMTQGREIKEVKAEDNQEDLNNKKGEQAKMTEEKKEEVISSEKAEKLPEDIVKAEEDVIDSPEQDLKKDEEEAKTEEVKEEVKTEEQPKTEEVKPEVKTEEVKTEEVTTEESEEVKTLKAEIEVLKAQLQKKDEEITAKVEEAKKQTALLIERKSVLGSFAKDISDAEILEEAKFEILRLKKENAELKQSKLEKSSLEVGGEGDKKEEGKDKEEDRGFALGKKIQATAFPQTK